MNAGSGAKVLAAWSDPSTQRAVLADAEKNEATVEVVVRNYDDVRDVVAERVAQTLGGELVGVFL